MRLVCKEGSLSTNVRSRRRFKSTKCCVQIGHLDQVYRRDQVEANDSRGVG